MECGTLWIDAVVTFAEASAGYGAGLGAAVAAGAGAGGAAGLTDVAASGGTGAEAAEVLWAEDRKQRNYLQ